MEFRLLGPLEVRRAGELVPLGGRRQRAVLAALLLRANTTASTGYLASAVWETPPVAPESNLRTFVAGLRRRLRDEGAAPVRLLTRPGGYLLVVHPGELDLDTFQDLAGQGERALRHGDHATAADRLDRALRLWRGTPLAELSPTSLLQAEVTRLEELRLGIAEQHARAHTELGRPEAVIGGLRALLAEHPLREELWARLMLALHRAGRQADALEVFGQARRHLIEQAGIEPGPRLRQVQREILAGAPEPAPEPSTVDDEVAAWQQLPMDISEFTGRRAELRRLRALVDEACAGRPGAVAVVVVEGMAGVGKTRLAVHAAHQFVHEGRFADVQLWADLRGFDPQHPPAGAATVLEGFLRLLGVPGERIPQGLEPRAALYRDRLAGRDALILLDNAASEEQVRPLLPGAAEHALVLVTSRRSLAGLDGARCLPLDVFAPDESVVLLAQLTQDHRVAAAPHAARRVAELCGHLPIAVSLAARRLRSRPAWSVTDLVDRLEHGENRLDDLAPPRTRGLPAVFDLSYRALPPRQQRTFRLLGLHPGEDFTAESTSALVGTTPQHADLLLEALLDEHVLHQATAGRYRFHDLMRSYARERARLDEDPADRRASVHRLLTWYLHAAEAARAVLDPQRTRIISLHPLPAGCVLPGFADHAAALRWFEANRAALLAAVRAAAEHDLLPVAWQLPWVLLSFYYRRSHWDDWLTTHRVALDAARALGDRRAEGITWRNLGVAHSDLRQFDTAIDCHRRAEALLAEVGDRHGQAWNLNNVGVVYVDVHRLAEAADCFSRALPMFQETGDQQGEAICLNNLGDTHRLLGEPDRATDCLERALALQRRRDDQSGLRYTLSTLGDVHHDTGRHQQALSCYRQALAISQALGDQRTTARALAQVAATLHAIGDTAAAREHWRRALAIFDELGDRDADEIRARLAALD
ncbi:AfsR/SARP family transcriptional regulator [Goodfellowiella coeruleoviolacea]|uniref:DNA-binding transcriptional activator of the SARP family n=1 Tax=Goodfellowiella coeruleoviolacea TaxID=334858 RepID=A0AAE3GLY9_9PSEU|nr:BTAD domain-containing putative transcriptional regulator [Goodfellowiella coeruleoviolacea]MCP2169734.1 DNA-binding transcriptional activator of the SARP family [Goodfellowiella coeruleoviolacea]